MSSSSRPSSPLATPGRRTWLAVSPQSAAIANLAAARHGVTQRMLVDALLGDVNLVDRTARKLLRKRGSKAAAERKTSESGSTSSGTAKTTHQDCAGRTQTTRSDP